MLIPEIKGKMQEHEHESNSNISNLSEEDGRFQIEYESSVSESISKLS